MDNLKSVIDQIGRVQVLVTLSPGAALVADAEVTEAELSDKFIPLPAEQADALDAAADARLGFALRRRLPTAERRVRVYPRLGLAIGYVDAAGLSDLGNTPGVTDVSRAPSLSSIRPPQPAVEVEPPLALAPRISWGIRRLGIDRLWVEGLSGAGVRIGHIDTGVDGSHPDLTDRIAAWMEFDLSGERVPGTQPHDSEIPSEVHGTHTAGTLCARRESVQGSYGCAPAAKLVSALVIERGKVLERIVGGLEWALESGIHVLNLSVGLRGFDPGFLAIIDALRRNDVLPVIAVGNEGPGSSRSPGNYSTVLSVGACSDEDRVSSFSSSQTFLRPNDPTTPDLVAPGGEFNMPPGRAILSCMPGNRFAEMVGTSMATPHIAGLAALLKEAVPAASNLDIEECIQASCSRPGTMDRARANRGVPDGPIALSLLRDRAQAAGIL